MPRTHLSRRFVTLAASAIAAVYAAGYLRTESADSLLAASSPGDVTEVALTQSVPSLAPSPPTAISATVTPTPSAITDQAVELYADQHHVTWDAARAQMQATAGLPSSTAAATTEPSVAGGASSTASQPEGSPSPQPTGAVAAPARPSPTSTPRAAPVAPQPTPTRAAPVAPQPTATRAATTASGYKDGTYAGTGTSLRGNVQVSVAIQAGRIASVNITRTTTEYPTRDIANLPSQVVSRQSAQVDMVSGATYSSQAFRGAVQQALKQAQA